MVCGDLERAGLGARRLDLLFERVDGSVQVIRIGTARPGRDARHLGRMLDERLERVDPGLGVEAMRLVVSAADPLGFVQVAHVGSRRRPIWHRWLTGWQTGWARPGCIASRWWRAMCRNAPCGLCRQ